MADKTKAKNELEKNIEFLKKGASKVAHEISQPLQVLSMVLTQIEQGEVKAENVKRGQRMIEKIVELTDELKKLSIESTADIADLTKADGITKTSPKKKSAGSILIVDDNIDIVDMMIENFRLLGYDCDGANNGKNAIPLIEKNKYDLIISDLLMPRMSGKQLFTTVEKMNYKGKFLFLTGYVVSEELKKIVKKADGILYKPFQLEELFTMVNDLIAK